MRYLLAILFMVLSIKVNADTITAKSYMVTDSVGNVILEKNADKIGRAHV